MIYEFTPLVSPSERFLARLLFTETPLPYQVEDSNFEAASHLEHYGYAIVRYSGFTVDTSSSVWTFENPSATVLEITEKGRLYFEMKDVHEKGIPQGNTMTVYGDIIGSQLQQGVVNSSQHMSNGFDYESALSVVEEITKFTSDDNFNAFGGNAEEAKKILDELHLMLENQEEPSKVKQAFVALKDLTIGVSAGLISSGILVLIAQFLQ